jgi:hypothetical protein
MRLFVFIVTLLLFLTQVTLSQVQIENKTTRSGEWARYEVYYNWGIIWMNAAEVIFSTTDSKYNDANALKLRCVGRTYDSYDWFFCVRDTFESIVDSKQMRKHVFEFEEVDLTKYLTGEEIEDIWRKLPTGKEGAYEDMKELPF